MPVNEKDISISSKLTEIKNMTLEINNEITKASNPKKLDWRL